MGRIEDGSEDAFDKILLAVQADMMNLACDMVTTKQLLCGDRLWW